MERRYTREQLQGDEGFTLAELLVSLAILALIATFMSGGLRFGTRVWERAERTSAALEEVVTVQAFLRRLLSEAYPARVTKGSPLVDFEGLRNEAKFISTLPEHFGGGLLVPTRLFVERGRSSQDLKIEWCFDELEFDGLRGCHDEILIEDADHIELLYTKETSGENLALWRNQPELPGLVTIKIAFTQEDPRLWPDFAVRPLIDQPSSCRFDPISKKCRGE